MIMVRLLISEGSWFVLRVAENATRPVPERTDMPRALPDGSAVGLESHTTRHFPSSVIGSVSFWQVTSEGSKRSRTRSPTKTEQEVRQGEEGRDTQGIAQGGDTMWVESMESPNFDSRTGLIVDVFWAQAATSWMERNDQRSIIQ